MKKHLLKGAFIDRDGVINEDLSYVYKSKDFIFKEGIFELLKILSKKNYLIFIITNQSGIARGYFTELEYKEITNYYINIFKNSGINICDVYHCPHHPNFSEPPYNNCSCRKPNPGLFIKAQKQYKINMSQSIAIGDSLRDLEAAYHSNIKKRILLSKNNLSSKFITHKFKSLLDCSEYLLNL